MGGIQKTRVDCLGFPYIGRSFTVELRFKEPLYNEVLGVTNDFLYPSSSRIYEKEPR